MFLWMHPMSGLAILSWCTSNLCNGLDQMQPSGIVVVDSTKLIFTNTFVLLQYCKHIQIPYNNLLVHQ